MPRLKALARESWSTRPMELAAALSYYTLLPLAPLGSLVVVTLLFAIGKSPIGLYLGRTSIGSPYGAAGSLVVMTVWVFYASMMVFVGAELTAQCGGLPAVTHMVGDGARAGGDPVRPRSAVHRELARAGPACVDVSALSLALPPAWREKCWKAALAQGPDPRDARGACGRDPAGVEGNNEREPALGLDSSRSPIAVGVLAPEPAVDELGSIGFSPR